MAKGGVSFWDDMWGIQITNKHIMIKHHQLSISSRRPTDKGRRGLFDRLGDVAHVADLWPVCIGARQGGHGLDGAQVVLQLQDQLLLLGAGMHRGCKLHLQLRVTSWRQTTTLRQSLIQKTSQL